MEHESQMWPTNALNKSETSSLLSQHSPSFSSDEKPFYHDYQPPSLDFVPVPQAAIYMIMAVVVVVGVAYAIVGHLMKDLAHDLADYLLGPQLQTPAKEDLAPPRPPGFQPIPLIKTHTCTCTAHHLEEVRISLWEAPPTT